jgi:uncharacterized protein (TIGR04255 family)
LIQNFTSPVGFHNERPITTAGPAADMTFPASERVIYSTNPLEEVICQLRFPPILRIDSDVTDFQEAIRAEYPFYSEEQLALPGLPPQILELMKAAPASGPKPAKRFGSADERWTVSITREFVALQTTQYTRWEEFRQRLRGVLDISERIFRPAFYTRVGLRYRDVIRRPALAVNTLSWSQLLQPHIAGELSTEIAPNVKELLHVSLIALSEHGNVRLRHGLSEPNEGSEPSYTIDADFFSVDRTELTDVNDRLDYFNREAARLFRWCIDDRLHAAMGPRPIEPTDV